MERLTTTELLKIHAALFPRAPSLRFWHKGPKSKLVERLEAMCAELPESAVFTSPTAGVLIIQLLGHGISHANISVIVRRRFPSSKVSLRRVRRLDHVLKAA